MTRKNCGRAVSIDRNGKSVTTPITKAHANVDASPELPHEVLGRQIFGSQQLVEVSKELTGGKAGYATLIVTNARSEVQAMAEVPAHHLIESQKLRAIVRVRRFMRMTGSHGQAFIVGENPSQFAWLMKAGEISDALDPASKTIMSDTVTAAKPSELRRDSVLAMKHGYPAVLAQGG